MEEKQNVGPIYLSSELLLQSAKDEYTKERERSIHLDNKAGVFIAAHIALLAIFLPIIPFGSLGQFFLRSNGCAEKCFMSVCITILLLAFGLIVRSLLLLYRGIKVKNFKRVSFENLKDITFLVKEPSDCAESLIYHYDELVSYNIEVNNQKADSITEGIRYALLGIGLMALTTIVMMVLIGE